MQRSLFPDDPPVVTVPAFDGETIDPEQDNERLGKALDRVYDLMRDGHWRTLGEIAYFVGCSEAGASARLRDLRKDKFKTDYPNAGVEKKRVDGGLWFYRLEVQK